MGVRDLGHKRMLQRPVIEVDDLTESTELILDGIDVESAKIVGGDYSGAAAAGRIDQAEIVSVNLAESQLGPLHLSDTVLRGVDLSNAAWLSVTARRVEIINCRATGWRPTFELAQDVFLDDCRLDYCVLTIAKTKGANAFKGCVFRNATLRGDLTNVIFDNCLIEKVEFLATAAKGCDLRTSRLDGLTGLMSLRGATITSDQAIALVPQLATEAGITIAP